MEPASGKTFGAYRVGRRLGEGGMGAVWEAKHEGLQKRVAIKTLHASVATNAEAVTRFIREGQAASRIRHPHVVDVTDVGVHEGTPYLVMEFLDGEPLASLIERSGALPVETVVAIALPTLDALHAAHAAGVVHRDLKPDNVFLRRSPTHAIDPVVLDFGISKVDTGDSSEARLTRTASLMGTPYYMSPEQARGAKHIDARSDQFALGLVLYEAASGRRAVEGESVLEIVHKIAQLDFPPLETLRGDLPPGFVRAIQRMLEGRPEARFASMRDAGAALLPFADPTTRSVWARTFATDAALAATVAASSTASLPPASAPAMGSTFRQMSRESLTAPPPRAGRGWLFAAIAIVGIGGGSLAWTALGGAPPAATSPAASPAPIPQTAPPPAPPATSASPAPSTLPPAEPFTLRVGTSPAGASISLDGQSLGTAPVVHAMDRDGVPHVLEITAAGYIPQRIEFLDVAPVEHVALATIPRGHRGPVQAQTSVMTATGLVAVDRPAAAPGPTPAGATDDDGPPTDDRPRPARDRSHRPTADEGDEGEVGANGSVIIR